VKLTRLVLEKNKTLIFSRRNLIGALFSLIATLKSRSVFEPPFEQIPAQKLLSERSELSTSDLSMI